MRVLIFEPQYIGHNLVHAARLVRGVTDLGCEAVLATSRQAVESPEFALHLGAVRDRVTLLPLEGFRNDRLGRRLQTGGLFGAISVYRSLKSAIDRTRPGHVYVPYGNFLARTAAAPFGLKRSLRRCGAEAETLIVGGRYLYPKEGLLPRLRQRTLLNLISQGPWSSVFHLDDAAYDQFQRYGGRMAQIGKLLPEPIGAFEKLDRQSARKAFGLPTEGRALAIVGLIELRKGLEVLFKALRSLSGSLRPNDRLMLIGPCHPEVIDLLTGEYADLIAAGRVICVDRKLSEPDMAQALCAADVVATVYPNHPYCSGVLVAAAAVGRPVLGSDFGWIGRTIRGFEMGQLCDPADPGSVERALLSSLESCGEYQPSTATRRFVEFTSDENYLATWTARLRERIGLKPSPGLRSWDWAQSGASAQAA